MPSDNQDGRVMDVRVLKHEIAFYYSVGLLTALFLDDFWITIFSIF